VERGGVYPPPSSFVRPAGRTRSTNQFKAPCLKSRWEKSGAPYQTNLGTTGRNTFRFNARLNLMQPSLY
jgi:hypothetical protein